MSIESLQNQHCPFCLLPNKQVFYKDSFVYALWDAFPVSKGHALIVTRRHIVSWFEASEDEQLAILRAIVSVREEVQKSFNPDGFNIGINIGVAAGQTIFHLHIHVIPRFGGDVLDPRGGVRHVIPARANYLLDISIENDSLSTSPHNRALIRGEDDPILPHLLANLDISNKADIAVAFVLESGVRRLEQHLRDLLDRGGKVRILTGDYFDVTEPNALLRLLDLEGDLELRVFETKGQSFHLKSYIFRQPTGEGIAYVGSSNLTAKALMDGIEWNYRVVSSHTGEGFSDVTHAFEDIFHHTATRPVDVHWVEEYRKRRTVKQAQLEGVEVEPPLPIPEPHAIQREALEALEKTRQEGNAAGLVVLATGLGKTWLSAFDSHQPTYRRILFVAHREEILAQAMQTFRTIRPTASLGRYSGNEKTVEADVTFASVQTLGRQHHLENFVPDAFDYLIVDEFHHAAARTYQRLISYFKPKFLLGLTATPERTDGGDLLALCQENLVYRCDVKEGIDRGLLSPFHYFGVPDEVDYTNIPWRSTRFDEEKLTLAVATQSRAQNALEQYTKRAGTRTLAFCCSQRHADYMADFFARAGVSSVAVHSGTSSAPRATSLEKLYAGDIKVIFAVDIFNEGLDLPNVDTVMMLRPTESRIIWMQQFGRGLRRAEGKPHLTVIDYIGNHRTFLVKPQTLLSLGSADSQIAAALQLLRVGGFDLPKGCEITYELEAIDIIKSLLREPGKDEALKFYYEDFWQREGVRPSAVEAFHDGYNPRSAKKYYGSWLGFVQAMGGLSPAQQQAVRQYDGFLQALETTPMVKSYKMIVLLAMLNENCLPGEMFIDELVESVRDIAERSAKLKEDFGLGLRGYLPLRRLLEDNPINAWVNGQGTGGTAYFRYEGEYFRFLMRVSDADREPLQELMREIVDWRLAEYLQRSGSKGDSAEQIICNVSHTGGRPLIFLDRNKYKRIPSGWAEVEIDGDKYQANFVKVAVNVVRRSGAEENQLPILLRRWFGTDAGLPGTQHKVVIEQTGEGYKLSPLKPGSQSANIELWRSYPREKIPALFGATFNKSVWQTGMVILPGQIILLVTLEKEGLGKEFQYEDQFLSADVFQWQSQNRTTQGGSVGQSIQKHRERGIQVHLFVRKRKRLPAGGATPFTYCGELDFIEWRGERPITVKWRLATPLQKHIMSSFSVQ